MQYSIGLAIGVKSPIFRPYHVSELMIGDFEPAHKTTLSKAATIILCFILLDGAIYFTAASSIAMITFSTTFRYEASNLLHHVGPLKATPHIMQ
jgi:hypothetical protein